MYLVPAVSRGCNSSHTPPPRYQCRLQDLLHIFAAVFAAAPAARYFLPRWVSDVPCGRATDLRFQIPLGTSHPRTRRYAGYSSSTGIGLNQVGRSWLLLKVKAHYIAEQLDRAPYDVIIAKKAEIQALRCLSWMHLGWPEPYRISRTQSPGTCRHEGLQQCR